VAELPCDVERLVALGEQQRGEAVAEVVVVPTSAQARICRCRRYADVVKKGLLRAVLGVERSA